jgi:hypothetical protein
MMGQGERRAARGRTATQRTVIHPDISSRTGRQIHVAEVGTRVFDTAALLPTRPESRDLFAIRDDRTVSERSRESGVHAQRHLLRVGGTLGGSSAWVGTRNDEGFCDIRAHPCARRRLERDVAN